MARPPKLKVYRMAVGFHDAYVAAPSQKAAAAAWGSGTTCSRAGEAELVTDPALTAEPLARPGEIVKRLRGTAAEQIAALGRRAGGRARSAAPADPRPVAKPGSAGPPRQAPAAQSPTPEPGRARRGRSRAGRGGGAPRRGAAGDRGAAGGAGPRASGAGGDSGEAERERLESAAGEGEADYREAMRRGRGK
jgi:hypothetical protein